jgi:hypothetical protein
MMPEGLQLREAQLMEAEFIAEGSSSQINLAMEDREKVMGSIQTGMVDSQVFEEAESHVIHLLRFSVIPLWMATPGYKELMKKLEIENIHELSSITPSSASQLIAQFSVDKDLLSEQKSVEL